MKAIYSAALMVAAVALLAFMRLRTLPKRMTASNHPPNSRMCSRPTSKNDDIKIHSKDGAVTLTGNVSEESHKSLAQETVAGLPGVKSVDNKLEVKGERPAENSDAWLSAKVKTTLCFTAT